MLTMTASILTQLQLVTTMEYKPVRDLYVLNIIASVC